MRTILGVGLYERVYKLCLARELERRGHNVRREFSVPIVYEGEALGDPYKCDLLVDDRVLIEAKAVRELHAQDSAQLLSYMRLAKKPLGLLVNFNAVPLGDGIKQYVFSEYL